MLSIIIDFLGLFSTFNTSGSMQKDNIFLILRLFFMKTLSVFFGISILITMGFSVNAQQKKSPNPPAKKPECLIKGNISVSSGKKWYHLPGMEDYEKTRIDPGASQLGMSIKTHKGL